MLEATGNREGRRGRIVVRLATALLLSGGLGWAGLGLVAGTAHAGVYHWCPGDPPPQVPVIAPNGHTVTVPIHPAWDTNVCHDYVFNGGHVEEGTPCFLPTFQQFMCPPGTIPQQQMRPIPNVGEG
jgi:hypothetical protein